MTGTSAFSNLTITNTSGNGSSTLQSVRFITSASTTGTLTMLASTSANFKASATSTFQNISLQGSAGSPVYIRSSIPGTRATFYVPGTQTQVTYVDVKDSSACPTTISATSGTDSGNNLCWTFSRRSRVGTVGITGTLYTDEGITPYHHIQNHQIRRGYYYFYSCGIQPPVPMRQVSFLSPIRQLTYNCTHHVTWVNAMRPPSVQHFSQRRTAATTTMTGVPLYKDRVIVSHEGATTSTSTSVTDLAFYDNSDDTDIQYSATSSYG